MALIEVKNLNKTFKVLKQKEGLKGAIQNLFSKDYEYISAVDGISMNINQGEIVGFLGPNGAGKSTTIKMLTGILKPTSGLIEIDGVIPNKERKRIAKNIGVVFGQRTQLWWALPVSESFRILKEIYQVGDKAFEEKIQLYNTLVDFEKIYHKPVRQLSLGQRTLCDLLAAFLHDPKIVFLDEPTIGLDVSIKHKMRNLIKALNEKNGTTIILTTHDVGDIESLCNRVVIINQGRIIFDDSYLLLKKLYGLNQYLQIVKPSTDAKLKELEQICSSNNLKIKSEDEKHLDIFYDDKQISILTILNLIKDKVNIDKISFQEIKVENVIRKIYEDE